MPATRPVDWARVMWILVVEFRWGSDIDLRDVLRLRLASACVRAWFEAHPDRVTDAHLRHMPHEVDRAYLVRVLREYDVRTANAIVRTLHARGEFKVPAVGNANPLAAAASRGGLQDALHTLFALSRDNDYAPAIAVATERDSAVWMTESIIDIANLGVDIPKDVCRYACAVLSCPSFTAADKIKYLHGLELNDSVVSVFVRIAPLVFDGLANDLSRRRLYAAHGDVVYVNREEEDCTETFDLALCGLSSECMQIFFDAAEKIERVDCDAGLALFAAAECGSSEWFPCIWDNVGEKSRHYVAFVCGHLLFHELDLKPALTYVLKTCPAGYADYPFADLIFTDNVFWGSATYHKRTSAVQALLAVAGLRAFTLPGSLHCRVLMKALEKGDSRTARVLLDALPRVFTTYRFEGGDTLAHLAARAPQKAWGSLMPLLPYGLCEMRNDRGELPADLVSDVTGRL